MSRHARIPALLFGALLVGIGLLLLPNGAGFGPMIIGLAVLLSLVFEGRYRRIGENAEGNHAPSGNAWQLTAETFRDEESGQWVNVWFNPRTGERRYVATESPRD